jgi:hypothetical protein
MLVAVYLWHKTRGVGAGVVGHVDTLDEEFKSLYPLCLFFNHMGFSFVQL